METLTHLLKIVQKHPIPKEELQYLLSELQRPEMMAEFTPEIEELKHTISHRLKQLEAKT